MSVHVHVLHEDSGTSLWARLDINTDGRDLEAALKTVGDRSPGCWSSVSLRLSLSVQITDLAPVLLAT